MWFWVLDLDCGRDRILRLMNEMGIEGLQKKAFNPLGTNSRHGFGYSPNLLRELGHPDRCDQVWLAIRIECFVERDSCVRNLSVER